MMSDYVREVVTNGRMSGACIVIDNSKMPLKRDCIIILIKD